MPNRVEGTGSVSPKLLIVGEAPGKYEDEQGIPFVGPTGKILDECLFKAGIRRGDCYITNVVKYRPPMNDLKKLHLIGIDIGQEMKELWENEISRLNPNCILAIGDLALQAVCDVAGILNYRGSILTARDGKTKVVPTLHPAALFSHSGSDDGEGKGGLSWTWLKCIESDIIRAVEESASPILSLPSPSLHVIHNSLELHRFFREYESVPKAASDIESVNCVPVCIGFAFNNSHGVSVPLLRSIGTAKLTDMGDNELDECWRIIDRELRRLKIIGHNFMYDEYKLSLIGFQVPNVFSDTLIKTRVLFPELPKKRLCDALSLWTRIPFYKDEGKEFRFGKDKIDNLLLYNAKDCTSELELDEAQEVDLLEMQEHYQVPLKSYYYDYMMKKHKFYLKLQNRGKRVDLLRQKELYKKYTVLQEEAHKKLVDLIGDEINVKSYPQVFELLYKKMKFKMRKKDPTSEDTIVALLGSHAKKQEQKDILTTLLEERRIRDQKSRQISFSPDYDGRCKSAYNIIATETCRSSTGILKKPLRPKKIGLADHTISAHGRLAKDIKSMFLADEGKVIIQVDASQAEPRIVAVLSKDWELLKAFDENVDIHRRTAGLMFGYTTKLELSSNFNHPIVDNLVKDGPERYTGKTIRNAGNYFVGKRTLMTTFNTNAQKYEIPMVISEWRAGQMLELFHNATPNVMNVFYRDLKDAIDSSRVLIDPYGGVRVFNGRMDDEIYKEAAANIPQRTVSHLVQKAALAVEEELNGDGEVYFCEEKHDALFLQAPENDWERWARLLKKHMETPIDFGQYCTLKRNYKLVIPGSVEVSHTNFASFEKVKL